ncbi:MAG: sigma-70 family RNA polymerase sigma factor [Planctomycetales bacterium]|nr:sigma-70 family RNA polymerase sigma factor [Planctomycetales bacterium]MBN8624922.1 sigma-70 family RNA polymerase sigma factor [Planctomycetota bacterium]
MNTPESASPAVVEVLVHNHRRFLDFLRSRVSNVEDAEEILQAAFVKAVEKSQDLRDEESAMAWFYRLLRNALIDFYRRRDTARKAFHSAAEDFSEVDEQELQRTVCQCVAELIPTLKPEYADLLRRVDVEGEAVPAAAAALGIQSNNAGVRLHRARIALKARLEQSCGTCATHGCLDCSCQSCK